MADPQQLTKARKGVRSLLRHSLGLSQHEEVLLISDEAHFPEIELICSVARSLKIPVCPLVVPRSMQPTIKHPTALPGIIREAIHHCPAMIVLIDYSARSTPFRMSLLRYFTDERKGGRAASMPGVTLNEFHYADADYEEIDRVATQIAHLLLRTTTIKIETRDNRGDWHILNVPVGRYFPTICGSVIEQGDWDNVPTGETFVLPIRHKARGAIAISGSVPGLVLSGKSSAILNIDDGKIVSVTSDDPQVESYVRALFFSDRKCTKPNGLNSHVLCEIGFGVNRAIKTLYGSPIFDEKMFGTIHVAFGRNDQLGGDIRGNSHHDLVVIKPRVYFDCIDTPIFANGRFMPSERQVELDWSEVRPALNRRWTVHSSGLHCSYEPKTGGLVMEWMQCAGPPASTRVGNLETSILAATAYRALNGPLPIADFLSRMTSLGLSEQVAAAAIEVLRAYKIIRIVRT